ncbi:MAG: DNA repair protein RadC [Pseudomonadota bacterium]
MSIRQWPEQERPREKLLQLGAQSLTDAELLAIFLRTGVKGCSAIDLAGILLKKFGGLRQLLLASEKNFCAIHGLGVAKFVQLQASVEMTKRFLQQQLQGKDLISCPEDSKRYLISQIRDKPHEVFVCLYLDNRHQIIHYEELFRGTIDGANVYPREVVKQALYYNAAAMIVAHNHPSGIAKPSQADEQITQRLKDALALVDIRLLDHFIIADNEVYSLAERGLLM